VEIEQPYARNAPTIRAMAIANATNMEREDMIVPEIMYLSGVTPGNVQTNYHIALLTATRRVFAIRWNVNELAQV